MRVELAAGMEGNLLYGDLEGEPAAVRAVAGEGIEGVGQGQRAAQERNLPRPPGPKDGAMTLNLKFSNRRKVLKAAELMGFQR